MRELELYMKRPVPVQSASALIDEKINELGDWRGKRNASKKASGQFSVAGLARFIRLVVE